MIDEIKFVHPKDMQDGKIEILEGLFPKSEIIQEGARTVKDGQEVQIIK